MARRTHGLDHLEDALAHAAFADLVVGAHQLEGLALDQRILLLLERRAGLAEALAAAARHRAARQDVGRRSTTPTRRAPWRTHRAGSNRCGWSRARTSGSAGR
jgi:hypothetical protein